MAEPKHRYEQPTLTADVVLLGVAPSGLQVLLIERGVEPFKGCWALPGGHVNPHEDPVHAAGRELAEETGVSGLALSDLAVFGRLGRDPRGWYVTAAFLGVVLASDVTPIAGDDAVTATWHSVRALPPLAFDHAEIIARAFTELGARRPAIPVPLPPNGSGPDLLLAAGITASGKSTFCRRLAAAAPGLIHLDLDQIRRDLTADTPTYSHAEAWASHNALRALTEWLLVGGHPVVVDASGLTAADRAHSLASGPLFGARTTLIWCETDQATAMARLERRAAGLDPLDHSTAKLDFWIKSLARRELPSLVEADDLAVVRPANADETLAHLVARLSEGV